jgi:hypothetical protein
MARARIEFRIAAYGAVVLAERRIIRYLPRAQFKAA